MELKTQSSHAMSRSNCITIIVCLIAWANITFHASASSVNADSPQPADNTLLEVSKAESIQIMATGTTTSITVKGLDTTNDNFYYNTEAKMNPGNSTFRVESNDISNVTVKETDRQITVSYVDAEGNSKEYAFAFTDPDNRSQNSYIGKLHGAQRRVVVVDDRGSADELSFVFYNDGPWN